MEWTAYRMSIVWFIHGKVQEEKQRSQLALHAIAARGDEKTVNKIIKGEPVQGRA